MKKHFYGVCLLIFNLSMVLKSQIEFIDLGYDQKENYYVAANFDRAVDCGKSNRMAPVGESDILLAKYDKKNDCQWSCKIGSKGSENITGMWVEESGCFYIVGSLTGETKIGHFKIAPVSGKSFVSGNFFIAKYNTSGDPVWVKSSRNTSSDIAYAVTGDAEGNVYVTGTFDGKLIWETFNVTSNGKKDAFVLKMNKSGKTEWIKNYGEAEDENGTCIHFLKGRLTIGGDASNNGKYKGVVRSLNSLTGDLVWKKEIGEFKGGIERITTDPVTNYLITGFVENPNNVEQRDLLVSKLSKDDGKDIWVKKFHGSFPIGRDIVTDELANIYVTGTFADTLRVDSYLLTGDTKEDIFLMKMNSHGKVVSASSFGDAKRDQGKRLLYRSNLLLAGSFTDGIKFGNEKINGGENSLFVAALDPMKVGMGKPTLLVQEIPEFDGNAKFTDIAGKLLRGTGKNKTFLNEQGVYLEDEAGNMLRRTITDENGDFSFKNIDANATLNLVLEKNATLKESEEIYLAQQNGIIVDKMIIGKEKKFMYKIIPAIATRLEAMEVNEDIVLKMKDFKTSTENELQFTERIQYSPGSFQIPPDAFKSLDQLVVFLKQNPRFKLEIVSHTDANGDENANNNLSVQRAEEVKRYLLKKQIKPERIAAKGLGEKQLLNRCENDVNCTEYEHAYNRRTEFKLIRGSGL